jgi:hypothetical protein
MCKKKKTLRKHLELSFWVRCLAEHSISKDITVSVIYINTIEEMWQDLKERFSHRNGPRISQLQKTISANSQGNVSMSFYNTKLKGLWDELIHCRPIPKCSSGSSKSILEYHHQDCLLVPHGPQRLILSHQAANLAH